MKSFIQFFTDARSVGTPLVAIRTFDPASVIQTIAKSFGDEAETIPQVSYDSIHGLRGLNDNGVSAVTEMCREVSVDPAATVDLPIALGTLEGAPEDTVTFVHNPQLIWNDDKKVIQAVWNLRDHYKANGMMLVMLIGIGDTLPVELQQDVLVLEDPLPTREELAKIVTDTFEYAAQADKGGKKLYPKCKGAADQKTVADAVDALIGLPVFPADQATAQSLDKVNGKLDIEQLWTRKKDIVSQQPGLVYHVGNETLKDMYGVEQFKSFGVQLMTGKYRPTLILRVDEIEKQLAGNGTDSSGTKGTLLGEFLTWVNDRKIICSLSLGVPGSSKSHSAYCIGGEFSRPVIDYSISAMEGSLVGESAKNMRNANRRIDAISDCRVWLIATANSLTGLPPELISRFQVGGIFFFDAPDEDERNGIMKLKIAKYGLAANQQLPDMNGWTGRDIDNCARKADLLGVSLVEAAQYVVPLMLSHKDQMNSLRQSASGRFLSASKPGVYEYTQLPEIHAPKVTIKEGRKMR